MIFSKLNKQYEKELIDLSWQDDYGLNGCEKRWIDKIFGSLAPNILTKSGNVNWMWVVWNIGKIVAKIVFAIKVSRR